MPIIMNDSRLININQLRAVSKGAKKLNLFNEKYKFVDQIIYSLKKFTGSKLRKTKTSGQSQSDQNSPRRY